MKAGKRELSLLIQDFDLHKVRELSSEYLHMPGESANVVLDMSAQQRLHALVGELRFEFANRARGIAEEASERRAHARLRLGAFEQDAVEDFDLIEMATLRFNELPPLVDRCFHNRVLISCEQYVRAVRFEEVLVNMEAWAKRFERCLQRLHRILLFGTAKTFVVHAGNTENHA